MKTIITILMLTLTGCATMDLVSVAGDFSDAGKQIGRHGTERVAVIYDERSAARSKRREIKNEIIQNMRRQASVFFANGENEKGMAILKTAIEYIDENMPSAADIVLDIKKFKAAIKAPLEVDAGR